MNQIILRKPDDMHIHLRQGGLLENVLEQTVKQVARAIVMPNTAPAIETVNALTAYRQEINESLKRINSKAGKQYTFEPLMTFKVGPHMTAQTIKELKAAGATAGKIYPQGVTTNSEEGVKDFKALYPIYEAMSNENLVLCIHGEIPSAFCIDREKEFLPIFKQIAKDFPKLKIVLEHLTTSAAVELVEESPKNVAGTLTVHHLLTTLDDIIGGSLRPHLFCKPLPKHSSDKENLRRAAVSGNPKFFLGSDSAPHLVENKECDCGAAGVYSAPVLLPLLIDIFQQENKLDKLESFTSQFGAEFYNLPLNQETMALTQNTWTVPDKMHGIVPFFAGQKLKWKVVES